MGNEQEAKRAVGAAAADLVTDGMRLGLGTGSTTAEAVRAIGARIRAENLRLTGVPTSFAAERLAREVGIPLATLDDVDGLDLAIDGADEVFRTPEGRYHLIKGRGAAHTREKVVAGQAQRFVVLVDRSKLVSKLGERMPIPIEVLPMAVRPVTQALLAMGAQPTLRMGERKDGPVVTDQGLWVIDARFDAIERPEELDRRILSLPGVLDHGLFLNLATDVLVGEEDGSVSTLS